VVDELTVAFTVKVREMTQHVGSSNEVAQKTNLSVRLAVGRRWVRFSRRVRPKDF